MCQVFLQRKFNYVILGGAQPDNSGFDGDWTGNANV